MMKLRVAPPTILGPPNGPLAFRVSATRQGAMRTNRSAMPEAAVLNDPVAELLDTFPFLATIRQ